jgi:hypothetical protein
VRLGKPVVGLDRWYASTIMWPAGEIHACPELGAWYGTIMLGHKPYCGVGVVVAVRQGVVRMCFLESGGYNSVLSSIYVRSVRSGLGRCTHFCLSRFQVKVVHFCMGVCWGVRRDGSEVCVWLHCDQVIVVSCRVRSIGMTVVRRKILCHSFGAEVLPVKLITRWEMGCLYRIR